MKILLSLITVLCLFVGLYFFSEVAEINFKDYATIMLEVMFVFTIHKISSVLTEIKDHLKNSSHKRRPTKGKNKKLPREFRFGFIRKPILVALCFISSSQAFSQASCDGEFHQYQQFSLCYCEQFEQSLWVHYVLEKNEIFLPGRERLSQFLEDFNISTGSAQHEDYIRSGYDRGHLSRAMYNKASEQAYKESFFMSNVSPQLPGFNRTGGDWFRLEELEIALVKAAGMIESFSGPIFLNSSAADHIIGLKNRVTVPSAFFKAIFVPAWNQMFAFILEHDEIYTDLLTSMITIDSLENLLDVDLFLNQPDSLEAQSNSTMIKDLLK